MIYADMAQAKSKIIVGKATIYTILAVSFAASIGYWYVLSGIENANGVSGFWQVLLWLIVAVGAVAELIKKVSLSTFRHKGIWIASTIVSVITVLGCYQILDADRQNNLIKQSDSYQSAKSLRESSLNRASEYAYAANYNIDDLEAEKQTIVDDRAKRKISYQVYKSKLADIEQKIIDYRLYQSAKNTADNTKMEGFAGENVSSNPLLSNTASATGVNENLLKTLFFLAVTLIMEAAAFYFGGQVEKLERELRYTQAELLDIQNAEIFGFTMAQVQPRQYQNVVTHEQKTSALPFSKNKKTEENVSDDAPKKVQTQNRYPAPHENVSNVLGAVGSNAPEKVQSAPKQVQVQQVHTRDAVTADTGTSGETSQRYRAIKSAIVSGELKPSFRAIRAFKFGGKGMGQDTAKRYHAALKSEGIIT